MHRSRRRDLFPADHALQARMVLAAVLTPLFVLAALALVVALAPVKVIAALAGALVLGVVLAEVERRRRDEAARELSWAQAPELHAVVERLCLLADLPRPRLVLEAERQPNSWVVAPPRRSPSLHLTRGLLDALAPAELEAVLAHELAHLANRDATIMTVVGGPGAALLRGGGHLVRGGSLLGGGGVVAWGIGAVSHLGTAALSRHRELAADAGAVALTGRPAALATALRKVSGELERLPGEDLRAVSGRDAFHLLPVVVERRAVLRRVAPTHPPLHARLTRLDRLEREMHAARAPEPRA